MMHPGSPVPPLATEGVVWLGTWPTEEEEGIQRPDRKSHEALLQHFQIEFSADFAVFRVLPGPLACPRALLFSACSARQVTLLGTEMFS